MKHVIGDNVFLLSISAAVLPLLATLGIIMNILIRDGPEVPVEIQFLEFIVTVGVVLNSLLGAFHTFRKNKPEAQP